MAIRDAELCVAGDEWVHKGFMQRYRRIAKVLNKLMDFHGVFNEFEGLSNLSTTAQAVRQKPIIFTGHRYS